MASIDITGSLTQEYLSTYKPYFSRIENLKFYIHDKVSLLEEETSTYSWSFWDGHAAIAEKAFKDLDAVIDLDFQRTTDISQADIHLYRVSTVSPYVDEGILGYAMPSTEGAALPSAANKKLFQTVFWASAENDNSPFLIDEPGIDYGIATWKTAHTIIHEIGHALGLSHPQIGTTDDPQGAWHNTEDTIMSYNSSVAYNQYGIFAYAPSWSDADIATLLDIWGPEDGDPITSVQGSAGRLTGTASQDNFVFSSTGEFGISLADTITGFNPDEGDRLILNRFAFPGLKSPAIRNVSSGKMLNKALKSKSELIYYAPLGQLYYNENSSRKGFGSGGLFAVLEGAPLIGAEQIEIV
jgi:hypothetical protein